MVGTSYGEGGRARRANTPRVTDHLPRESRVPGAYSAMWYPERIFRQILVSVKFVSAILGPEIAAPILWTPGKMRPFCRKPCVHKIPRFGGGGYFGFLGGGGSADFIFMGARIFLKFTATIDILSGTAGSITSPEMQSGTVPLCCGRTERKSIY